MTLPLAIALLLVAEAPAHLAAAAPGQAALAQAAPAQAAPAQAAPAPVAPLSASPHYAARHALPVNPGPQQAAPQRAEHPVQQAAAGTGLAGTVLAGTTPAGAAPRASMGPYADTLTLSISRLSPLIATETDRLITIVGHYTNTGPDPITDLAYRFQRGDRIADRAGLAAEQQDPGQPVAVINSPFTDMPGSIDPGATSTFVFSVPITGGPDDTLAITEPGVYPLMVNVNGTVNTPDGQARARVGELHLTVNIAALPDTPPGPDSAPPEMGIIWPLADRPHLAVGGVFRDDDLAAAISPGGRLASIVQALTDAAGPTADQLITLAVDPMLLDELDRMSRGYQVLADPTQPQPPLADPVPEPGPPATSTAPTSSESSSQPDSESGNGTSNGTSTATEAGAPGTVAGSGQQAAIDFLTKLRALARSHQVIVLPYGDPDIVALVRAGMADTVSAAVSLGRATATRILAEIPGSTGSEPPSEPPTAPPAESSAEQNGPAETPAGTATDPGEPPATEPVAEPPPADQPTDQPADQPTEPQPTEPPNAAQPLLITDVALPPGGVMTARTWQLLTTLGYRTAVLDPAGIKERGIRGPAPIRGSTGASSEQQADPGEPPATNPAGTYTALLTGAKYTKEFTEILSGKKAADSAQTISALGARLLLEPATTAVIITAPRHLTASPAGLSALTGLIHDLAAAHLITPAPVLTLAAGQGAGRPITLAYPATARTAELPGGYLLRLGSLAGRIAVLSDVLHPAADGPDPAAVLTPLTEALTPATSAALRGHTARGQALLDTVSGTIDRLYGGVILQRDTGRYTLASATAPLLLTIRNTLPYQVTVLVDIERGEQVGLTAVDPGPITIDAGPRSSDVKIATTVSRSGTFTVLAQLRSPTGAEWGPPVVLTIDSRAYGPLTIVLMIAAGGILALMVIWRLVQRLRGRDSDPGNALAEEAVAP